MSETIAPKRYKIFANLFIKLLSLKFLCFYDIRFVFCSLLVIRANMLAIIDKIEPVKIAKTKVVMTKPFDIFLNLFCRMQQNLRRLQVLIEVSILRILM